MTHYNADSLDTKTDMEHVRMYTGMYLGETPRNTAIREIFDNSIDEIIAGYGSNVRVKFYSDDSIEITDSGRGIPTDYDSAGVNGIVKALGKLRSGGKFDAKSYSTGNQAGLHGVGAAGANAISERFSVRVYRDGKEYALDFKEGMPGHFAGVDYDVDAAFTNSDDPLVNADSRSVEDKTLFPTGTSIRLTFDSEIAQDDVFDRQLLFNKTSFYPYLVPHLNLIMVDEEGKESTITGEGGLPALLDSMCPPETLLAETKIDIKNTTAIHRRAKGEEITVPIKYEVIMGWEEKKDNDERLLFVNAVNTAQGVHETSFLSALEEAFQNKISSMKVLKKNESTPTISDILEGSRTIISIEMSSPPFVGQDKHGLRGKDIHNALRASYLETLTKWLAAKPNQEPLAKIVDKIVNASRIRELQTIAKNNARKKTSTQEGATLSMPPGFLACAERENSELLIVEGDSAANTVKAARDARIQAVFPIRGKIMNSYDMSVASILKNREANGIVQIIGAGVGKDFDVEKMNFDRIIIAADADKDGYHIVSLVMTLFYSIMRPIIEDERLFIALPPLFVVEEKKTNIKHYAVTSADKDRVENELNKQKIVYTVSRNKGLGEMAAEDFRETVLNPETRNIKRLRVEDIEGAEKQLEVMFGKSLEKKKWLEHERSNFDDEDMGD